MGGSGEDVIRVPWTRAELVAVKEVIEITPLFIGRDDLRQCVRSALKERRLDQGVPLDPDLAGRFAKRIVPVDQATATARAKLLRAVRNRAAVVERGAAPTFAK